MALLTRESARFFRPAKKKSETRRGREAALHPQKILSPAAHKAKKHQA
jgi:hypothetical protein